MFFLAPNEEDSGPKKGYRKGSKWKNVVCTRGPGLGVGERGAQLILAMPVFSLQSIQHLKAPIHVVF